MVKKQITARMTEETTRKIAYLAQIWEMPPDRHNSPVIERAIDLVYQQIIQKEHDMSHTFQTYAEALEAGYQPVDRKSDKDTSGANAFGYDYHSADGQETVTVWIEEARNRIGKPGAFVPMYPPR